MKQFSSELVNSKEIETNVLKTMHALFLEYYNGVSLEQFSTDIKNSTVCVIVKDNNTRAIAAFTALKIFEFLYKNKKIIIYCGGKTLSSQKYWGTNVTNLLQKTWLKKLIFDYLKNITTPYYVYFAPTGYKTFLLLVNNFLDYSPSPYKKNLELETIGDLISKYLYGNDYNPKTKLVDFHEYYALKENVTTITPELISDNPKVALFVITKSNLD